MRVLTSHDGRDCTAETRRTRKQTSTSAGDFPLNKLPCSTIGFEGRQSRHARHTTIPSVVETVINILDALRFTKRRTRHTADTVRLTTHTRHTPVVLLAHSATHTVYHRSLERHRRALPAQHLHLPRLSFSNNTLLLLPPPLLWLSLYSHSFGVREIMLLWPLEHCTLATSCHCNRNEFR